MVTKEDFNKVWKDSTKEDILNQFYYEHIAIRKAIEYINHAQNYGTMAQVMPHLKPYVNGDDLLNILQNGSEDNGNN